MTYRVLEKEWRSVWERKARSYAVLANSARDAGNTLIARERYLFAARCNEIPKEIGKIQLKFIN